MASRAAVRFVVVVVAGCGTAVALGSVAAPSAAAPGPSTSVAPSGTGRYTVVGPGVNGQPEHLFGIAAETLGDGRRYREILDLNRDRVQPDGRRMTDAVVAPGWILLLPADAKGPRVRMGTPPTFAPAGISAAPSSTTGAASGGGGAIALSVGAGGVAVVLLVAAAGVLRGGRRRVLDGPVSPVSAPAVPSARPDSSPAVPSAPPDSSPAVPSALPDREPEALLPAPVPIDAVPVPTASGFDSAGSDAPPSTSAAECVIDCAGDRARVRLIGSRTDQGHGWLRAGEPAPPGRAVIVAGESTESSGPAGSQEPRRLWIDLAAAPDAVTVIGDEPARLRFARRAVEGLVAAGADVTVVGAGLDEHLSDGCSRVADVGSLTVPSGPVTQPSVVVCLVGAGEDLAALRTWMQDAGARAVPVLIGDVTSARWSVDFG
ncbi:hypothetical protein [Dactylosporangium sp. CA-233914]|uniref:LysM peptidoglycan-binding domain-containing protein n=1 Tax=Dactylosporangium sp. CA-233914 TaxID=3239934 RepID=UPI003D919164